MRVAIIIIFSGLLSCRSTPPPKRPLPVMNKAFALHEGIMRFEEIEREFVVKLRMSLYKDQRKLKEHQMLSLRAYGLACKAIRLRALDQLQFAFREYVAGRRDLKSYQDRVLVILQRELPLYSRQLFHPALDKEWQWRKVAPYFKKLRKLVEALCLRTFPRSSR